MTSNVGAGVSFPMGNESSGAYGVTNTNKNNPKFVHVPQIDPSQALAYYAAAGSAQVAGIEKGLAAYQTALATSAQQMISGYSAANSTLGPLSAASNQAVNQQLMMLGMTPQSTTASYGAQLTGLDPKLTDTAILIGQANAEADPVQRAQMSAQIQQQIGAAVTQVPLDAQTQLTSDQAALSATNATLASHAVATAPQNSYLGALNGVNSNVWDTAGNSMLGAFHALQATQTTQQNAVATDTNGLATAGNIAQELQQLNSSFEQNYTPTLQQGYTGDQVTKQLEATPGYQFQLQQGTDQILRNQAAVGNIGTGNTQAQLQNFGQGLAQNAYNGYMTNLSNIINQGAGTTQQLAANQVNQGGYLSNLTVLGGQAANTAGQQEGAASAAALNNEGTASYNAAAANVAAQIQMTAIQANATSSLQASSMNLAGQASNQANQSTNANQAGAGFFQGMNIGGANSTAAVPSGMGYNTGSNGGAA